MARWCTACAAEREGKFCPECGAQLVDKTATCACGYTLPDGAKFCPECGRSVLAAASPQAEQAEPAHNPLLCLHCHSEQDDENWRFCVVCGEKRPDPLDETKTHAHVENTATQKPIDTVTNEHREEKISSVTNQADIPTKEDTNTQYSDINYEDMERIPLEHLENIARNSTNPRVYGIFGRRLYAEANDIHRALSWLRLGAMKEDTLAQEWLSKLFNEYSYQ